MNRDHIPQDPSPLDKFTRELNYAVDQDGNYTTGLSRGWDVKAAALGVAWEDIRTRIEAAKQKVMAGTASPVLFFMELRLMDIGIVAAYTGFWKWQVKRHLKPHIFRKLSDHKLARYAEVFEVDIADLKQEKIDEDRI